MDLEDFPGQGGDRFGLNRQKSHFFKQNGA